MKAGFQLPAKRLFLNYLNRLPENLKQMNNFLHQAVTIEYDDGIDPPNKKGPSIRQAFH